MLSFLKPRLLVPLLTLGLSVGSLTARAGDDDDIPPPPPVESVEGTTSLPSGPVRVVLVPLSPSSESMEDGSSLSPGSARVSLVPPPPPSESMDGKASDSSPVEIELVQLASPSQIIEGQWASPRSLPGGYMIPVEAKDISVLGGRNLVWVKDPALVPKVPVPEEPWEAQCMPVCDRCERDGKAELYYLMDKGLDKLRVSLFPPVCLTGHALGCGRAIYRCHQSPRGKCLSVCTKESGDCLKAGCIWTAKLALQATCLSCCLVCCGCDDILKVP